MASPLLLAVLTVVVAKTTAADAVTGETIAVTDGYAVVFFPLFLLFVVVLRSIFRGSPCFRFFNHVVINPLSRTSCLPIPFLGIVGGFSVSL